MASLVARWRRLTLDNEVIYLFLRSPAALIAGIIATVLIIATMAAPWIATSDPFDLASFTILDSFIPQV